MKIIVLLAQDLREKPKGPGRHTHTPKQTRDKSNISLWPDSRGSLLRAASTLLLQAEMS